MSRSVSHTHTQTIMTTTMLQREKEKEKGKNDDLGRSAIASASHYEHHPTRVGRERERASTMRGIRGIGCKNAMYLYPSPFLCLLAALISNREEKKSPLVAIGGSLSLCPDSFFVHSTAHTQHVAGMASIKGRVVFLFYLLSCGGSLLLCLPSSPLSPAPFLHE